jgi:drug/metabolite transporter (DMT)-like permease
MSSTARVIMIVRSTTMLAATAATLSSIANGAQLVATRLVVEQNDPLAIALLRYAIAFLCVAPLLREVSPWPSWRHVMVILWLGAIVAGICPWLLTLSLRYTTASRSALILCTSPLLTLITATVLGYERCTLRRLAGALCAVLGVLIGLSGRLPSSTAQPLVNFGDAIVLFTTMLLALFNVYAGAMLTHYRATTIVPIATIGGVIVLFGLAASSGSLSAVPLLTGPDWLAVLFCGTVGGAFVLLLWSWAIEHASAARVAVFVTAAPISAAFIGALVLAEPVTIALFAGLALIMIGIYLVFSMTPKMLSQEPRAAIPKHAYPSPAAQVREALRKSRQ